MSRGTIPGSSCSRSVHFKPGARKAHGNAGSIPPRRGAEPRQAGLFQAAPRRGGILPKAVLEQPSPSRAAEQSQGRRNIVLSQSDELNHSGNEERLTQSVEQGNSQGSRIDSAAQWEATGVREWRR
jgi:hypothetical protein